MAPPIGTLVLYRTDQRNGLIYDLPAIITCTEDSHPGDYPGGDANPLPVPRGNSVHLTVFSPGGFGTKVGLAGGRVPLQDSEFLGAEGLTPGSGTYVEWDVPQFIAMDSGGNPPPRSWRWLA